MITSITAINEHTAIDTGLQGRDVGGAELADGEDVRPIVHNMYHRIPTIQYVIIIVLNILTLTYNHTNDNTERMFAIMIIMIMIMIIIIIINIILYTI